MCCRQAAAYAVGGKSADAVSSALAQAAATGGCAGVTNTVARE
jgi:hypothetical protein